VAELQPLAIDDAKPPSRPVAQSLPLALYLHFPWCVRKCPYCDFNSHTARGELDEVAYVDALIRDLDFELREPEPRALGSIFMGGGTPSLFSGAAIVRVLREVQRRIAFSPEIEITLEANPGTADAQNFREYRAAGVNRLSIGVQSFDDKQLRQLGRIHAGDEAIRAFEIARNAGFDNINLDRLTTRLTEHVCKITNGPCVYHGRSMQASHAGLDLSQAKFNAVAEDFQTAMEQSGIPYRTQNRLMALLAPMQREIVTR